MGFIVITLYLSPKRSLILIQKDRGNGPVTS